MCSKRGPFHALLPLLRHVVPLNDGNCRLTIPVVKGRCAREALPHAFNIGVFKYGKSNPTTIKHIYNESTNLRTWTKVVTLLLTAKIDGIFHKEFQWLPWRIYGDTHWPSLHTRLLDAGHMLPNWARWQGKKFMSFRAKIHTVNEGLHRYFFLQKLTAPIFYYHQSYRYLSVFLYHTS